MIHARRLSASLGSQLLHEVLLPNDHLGALGNAVPGITEFEHADILEVNDLVDAVTMLVDDAGPKVPQLLNQVRGITSRP
jgi:hypothetical protein